LEAFVGPRPPGLVCCHEDGDPANNRVENLISPVSTKTTPSFVSIAQA
jgi:hypothetical protein